MFGVEHFLFRLGFHQIAVLIHLFLARTKVAEREADAFVQVGQLAQTAGEDIIVIDKDREDFLVGFERDDGTRIRGLAYDLDIVERLALGILLLEDLAFAVDFGGQVGGQGVHAGNTDTVQATGNLVAVLAEFAARVQHGKHHFQGTALFLLVHAGGDAAAIVGNRYGIVGIDGNDDVVAIAGECLIDRIVHYLIHQVVQTAGADVADVHGRALAHRFESFQNLDTVGRIAFVSFFVFH